MKSELKREKKLLSHGNEPEDTRIVMIEPKK